LENTLNTNTNEISVTKKKENIEEKSSLSRKDSIGSFDENANHDYINSNNNVTYAKKSEVFNLFL
jgi:hypothetical protein